MRARDPVGVSQTNPRADLVAMLEGGSQRLTQGTSMIVFPQGVRADSFEPREFNKVGIKMARRVDVPIVPFALKTDAWGNGAMVKDVGKIDPVRQVHFAFGEPIRIEGRGTDQHEEVIRFIEEKLKLWGK